MFSPAVNDLGDRELYRDDDTTYINHELMQEALRSRLPKAAGSILMHIIMSNTLKTPEEYATAPLFVDVKLSVQEAEGAIALLRQKGWIDRVLNQTPLSPQQKRGLSQRKGFERKLYPNKKKRKKQPIQVALIED